MKNLSFIVTTFIFFLVLVVGVFIFFFWRLGILKKEAQLSENILNFKQKTEFVINYPFANINNYIRNLSVQILPLPSISPEEIGRPSLF